MSNDDDPPGDPSGTQTGELATHDPEKAADEADHDAQVDADEMPFLAHLLELRQRLLRSGLVVVVLFFPVYFFANDLYQFVARPLIESLPGGSSMIATGVATPFLTPFKLSAFTAVFLAVPFLLHQAWGFVAPGLYMREKRFAAPLLVSSTLLFYFGMAFAYYLVFPLVFQFFASVTPEGVMMMTDINQYLDFVLKMFFAFGIAFEIPIATVLLILTGIVTPDGLARKRPYVVVGCFFVGMMLTPPDIISQVLLALPTWLLFEAGIFFGRLITGTQSDQPAVD